MNIDEALMFSTNELDGKIKNPRFEAELLLSEAIKQSREFILTHPEYILSEIESNELTRFTKARKQDTPLSYITNSKSFYGLEFFVDKNVLIPRPETEVIVDEVMEILRKEKNNYDNFIILDIGTGSGCIIISIAKLILAKEELKNKTAFYAVDISKLSLEIAKKNYLTHNLNKIINFRSGNLLDPIRESVKNLCIRNHYKIIITANLPYLTKEQIDLSPSIKKEPKMALDGGKDGMELYIELFKQIAELKVVTKTDITLLAEIDDTQKKVFVNECNKYFNNADLIIKKDLAGYDRCAILNI